MHITLKVVDGPQKGLEFTFNRHDTFLVGRSKHAHFQLPLGDKFCSRIHFMVEMNPPQCRLVDMGSHNGTYVNGQKVLSADLQGGDQIRAGHTTLSFQLQRDPGDPPPPRPDDETVTLAAADVAHEPAPDRIPGYTLEGRLGVGRIGVVHAATRRRDGARVALKIIFPAVAGTPTQVQALLAEAAPLTLLDHANIVRFLEMGEAAGVLYFAMEFVPGANAAAMLKKHGPLAERPAVRIICQVLDALAYAHDRNIIHRDIKPGNILLTGEDGKETVKLTDLGLARIYQSSPLSGLSIMRDFAASAPFLPPELITNYKQAAPSSDQYAAAATLYMLLTGKPVYDFPDEMHLQFSLLLEQQPIPIRQRRPDLSEPLAAVIHKALQRNPANRYKDVKTFRQALIRAVVKKP